MSGFNLPPGVSARDIPGNVDNEDPTGGPAFPANHFDLADNEHGMTLRDYFAAKAMAVVMAENFARAREGETETKGCPWDVETTAGFAYEMAAAMIEERTRW